MSLRKAVFTACFTVYLNSIAFAGADTIKIAIVNDQGGPFSAYGGPGSVIASRLAAEEFGGTVLGKKIEIVAADHQNKPDLAALIVRRMFDVDNVDVIVDGAGSAAALAIQGIARDKGKIFLITGASGDFTGIDCSPTGFHFSPDTYALARATAKSLIKAGGDRWYFVTADYAFGHSLERQARAVVEESGGKVSGSARHPLNSSEFSSFLLSAQSSGANVIGLANAGTDLTNAIKQAQEFQIVNAKTKLTGFLLDIIDIAALGLPAAKGITFANTFYWDANAETRAFAKSFMAKSGGKVPGQIHAGSYAAVKHYLTAVKAAGTDDGRVVAAKMRELPINNMYQKDTKIRVDGRVLTNLYINQAKSPEDSKYPFDYMKVVQTLSGEEAFRPLNEGGCHLVAQ
ncbi:MAG: ABC transporter substrate-binding protein [Pseudorhodoplanes sp.]|uniref:ABC transporter substrate-binding protein n=1 Tax=Pseudorhodoplanes sp. TaxID=1934341 RepID=UPI003D102FD0